MYDLVIKNGTVIDGTGEREAFKADVGVKNGKIAVVGDLGRTRAERIIDATGHVVSPGFIDVQNHSDSYGALFAESTLESMIHQGITTILVGQCGSSLAPLLKGSLASIQKWSDVAGVNVSWLSVSEFLREMRRRGLGVNLATLVGHATLRRDFAGDEVRALTAKESRQIEALLKRSLKEGAWGLSVGFEYSHDRVSDEQELIELLKLTASGGGVASFHLRDESREIAGALNEVLFLVSNAPGIKAKIAHFKIRNETNSALAQEVLATLEKGLYADVYPYTVSAMVLYLLLPPWATDGGRKALIERLKNKNLRQEIAQIMRSENYSYDKITVAMGALDRTFIGRTVAELAKNQSVSPEEIIFDLILASEDRVVVFFENLAEPIVEMFLAHPRTMIATDGSGWRTVDAAHRGLDHPRSFGTTARVLGRYVREKNVLTLEAAIHKMSGLPAAFLGIKDRGSIKEGTTADIVVFNPDTVGDLTSFERPYRHPAGIPYVIVNGEVAVDEASSNGLKAGRVLVR